MKKVKFKCLCGITTVSDALMAAKPLSRIIITPKVLELYDACKVVLTAFCLISAPVCYIYICDEVSRYAVRVVLHPDLYPR
jgi:hypothetical protein